MDEEDLSPEGAQTAAEPSAAERVAVALLFRVRAGDTHPYLHHHLPEHIANTHLWNQLTTTDLAALNPTTVATHAYRTLYGRTPIPDPVLITMTAAPTLATTPPDQHDLIRALTAHRLPPPPPPRLGPPPTHHPPPH